MKKLLTIIFSVVSFSALAAWQGSPMTTNKAAAYATTGQAPVFNGTQWVFVSTNAFGGGTATATNAIGNANGLGTNTSLFGNVGIGTTNPSHTLHVVTGTNNAVGVDSTGTDSASMLHIHNYSGVQGPFFDFGAPPGEWGFGMASAGAFNLRFVQGTNSDPVNGTTLISFSTNGVITADGSGLTNIPGSGLQSPLVIGDMTVSNLTVTNAYLNLANSTNLPEAGLTLAANTTNNVSTTKHGFAPVLPNDATKYLDGTGNYTVPPASSVTNYTGLTNAIGVSIDGGGASITAGVKGYIMAPMNSTIVGWSLASDSVGSCVVDVWKSAPGTYPPTVANSIAGSALPTLSTTNHYYTNTLAGWSTLVTNGDWFGWNVQATPTTISNLTLQIYTVPR